MVIVDQQRAHQRVLYEQFLTLYDSNRRQQIAAPLDVLSSRNGINRGLKAL
jgi:DNA mismatch repair ATPase MutL